jgi:ABC-type ATPase involved in cell division
MHRKREQLRNRPPCVWSPDEPACNLDSRTSVEIMEIFQNLNETGLTIVLVTHEPTPRLSLTCQFHPRKICHQ